MNVIDLCGEVVDVICLWNLIDAQPWSLVTVALWEVDVYVLAEVFSGISFFYKEGVDMLLSFRCDDNTSLFKMWWRMICQEMLV